MKENNSFSSCPDSGDSSPRSREIDCENAAAAAWDDTTAAAPNPSARVKLMVSYGGKIQPRSHDNVLSYYGGHTKILTVDRGVRFSTFLPKLCSLAGGGSTEDVWFKYQLPGEDLDSLVSVTNDEDLEHMMMEFDRLRYAAKPPPRPRIFVFPLSRATPAAAPEAKSDRQWFVDALNSVPAAAPAPAADGPDFLFGLEDKGIGMLVKEDQPPSRDLHPAAPEIQHLQMQQGIQRLQVDESPSAVKVCHGDCRLAGVQDLASPATVTETYWPAGAAARYASVATGDQAFYLIHAPPPGVYPIQAAGQGFYAAAPRVLGQPEMYHREAPAMYAAAGGGGVRVPAAAPATVAYDRDSTGRPVYFAGAVPSSAGAGAGAGTGTAFQAVASVAMNTTTTDGKVVKPPQVS